MDSALIYAASDSLKFKVKWQSARPESEWIYFGAQDEVNIPLALKTINEYFADGPLNIAFGRKDSIQVNKAEIQKAIQAALGKISFFVWDKDFKRVIEFNHIGVFRIGIILA